MAALAWPRVRWRSSASIPLRSACVAKYRRKQCQHAPLGSRTPACWAAAFNLRSILRSSNGPPPALQKTRSSGPVNRLPSFNRRRVSTTASGKGARRLRCLVLTVPNFLRQQFSTMAAVRAGRLRPSASVVGSSARFSRFQRKPNISARPAAVALANNTISPAGRYAGSRVVARIARTCCSVGVNRSFGVAAGTHTSAAGLTVITFRAMAYFKSPSAWRVGFPRSMPDAGAWAEIKKRSVERAAEVTITGFRDQRMRHPVSRGSVTLTTSRDPVGAPLFYRDVPLMPSELEKGIIKPLVAEAIPLVAWRVRNVGEVRSRVVMDNLPLCANCHSFSSDGKTMGMDLDGLQGNRGMYILAPVAPEMAIRQQDLIQWSSPEGKLKGNVRVGFMSQVSPDGQYVVTTVNPASMAATSQEPPSNYYVANFKDYRFLQVFYPPRGILSWYSRQTGVLQPLPGADDPQYVQMGAVWAPGGEYLVFARAQATDPNPPGVPLAQFANDPNELQLKYDLYRVAFHNGQGGTAEPIPGASRNGMSNTFPKVSPDGRWIVFVQCRNGQLMRPDSQLYIVPAGGGRARRMRCLAE